MGGGLPGVDHVVPTARGKDVAAFFFFFGVEGTTDFGFWAHTAGVLLIQWWKYQLCIIKKKSKNREKMLKQGV